MIEIEKKFQVDSFDPIRRELVSGNIDVIQNSQSKTQSDEYFNHQQLRFELQDIALRIRSVDERFVLTFKGPNEDATTKIRREIEVEFGEEDAAKMSAIFLGLGMHSVAKVCKIRDKTRIRWQGSEVEVCLDDVSEVGCFVELEIVVQGKEDVEAAKTKLESLAEHFGLRDSITTSYLEMLLRARGDM
jgi:adenylate cyclase class 2